MALLAIFPSPSRSSPSYPLTAGHLYEYILIRYFGWLSLTTISGTRIGSVNFRTSSEVMPPTQMEGEVRVKSVCHSLIDGLQFDRTYPSR